MDALIKLIAQWVTWVADRVVEWLRSTLEGIWAWIDEAIASLTEWFVAVLDGVFAYMDGLVTGLTSYFSTVLEEISAFVDTVWEAFLELTTVVIDEIRTFVENVWSEVRTAIESTLEAALDWLTSIAENVVTLINTGIEKVIEIAEQVKTTLVGWLDELLAKILLTYNQIVEGFTIALDSFLGPIDSFISTIGERLTELKVAFADAATDIVAGITETAEDTIGPIRDKIKILIEQLVPEGNAAAAQNFVTEARKLSESQATPQELRSFASDVWRKTNIKDGIWAEIFFIVVGALGSVLLLTQVTQISTQVMMQDFAKQYPFQMFTPGDVTQAWRRGYVSETFALDTIQRHGYTAENARIVLNLSEQVPTEGDLFVLMHRGLISDKDVGDALHQKGYNLYYQERMKEASFLIPPVNDLITMAVREAFTPEIAEKFGQYEDFPEDLAHWAEQQALLPEWARRYWAAHWALPSPQQGFEMLHRGVIDEATLTMLLRALDVMPFWRDQLIQIAYTPFTRIDIRRMHKMGVLTEEDVLRSYRDLGYDTEKARTMTDFVMLLNEPPSADDELEIKELSRSAVINFYGDGLIARDKALTLLTTMGYSVEAATLYLDSSDMDEERKERKESISLTLALAKAGVITFVQAEDRLRNLGLANFEVSKAITTLLREQERRTKLPSRAEAEKMLKLGIITMIEYKDLLSIFGYSEKWANNFATLAETSA